MNLSPDWVPLLQNAGWPATHWSTVGDPRATDLTIMDWAEANGHIVFTHDLDFGIILALTHKTGPSVLPWESGKNNFGSPKFVMGDPTQLGLGGESD